MYQTRGLFYPSLSQRLYQSNQGLKLAAKAVCHPKGELICLKSFRLPNDSNIDMKHNRHCFLLFLSLPAPSLSLLSADTASLVPRPRSGARLRRHAAVTMGSGCSRFTSGSELAEPARVNPILVSANSSTFAEEYERC